MCKPTTIKTLLCLLIIVFFSGCEVEDEIITIEHYLGKWKCEENSEVYGPGYNYDVTIKRNPENSSEIVIYNFYMQGEREKAVALVAGNILTILPQTICDDTIEIEGSGKYIKNEIHLNYTANDGADLDNVSAVYYRD